MMLFKNTIYLWVQTETGEVQVRYKEEVLYCEGGEALAVF